MRKNVMIKLGTHINQHDEPYICTKFSDFSLKNEPKNAKRAQLTKCSIMRIFNKAEPP